MSTTSSLLDRARNIDAQAEALLLAFGDVTTPAVPVDRVAEYLNLRIELEAFTDDVSGVLVINDGHGVIGVNSTHPLVRRRFTIAHEIGHFVLHREYENLGKIFIDIDKNYSVFHRSVSSSESEVEREAEREANAFAAALLMPRRLLHDAVREVYFDLGGDDTAIEQIANSFRVSKQAMSWRLWNLGLLGTMP